MEQIEINGLILLDDVVLQRTNGKICLYPNLLNYADLFMLPFCNLLSKTDKRAKKIVFAL